MFERVSRKGGTINGVKLDVVVALRIEEENHSLCTYSYVAFTCQAMPLFSNKQTRERPT